MRAAITKACVAVAVGAVAMTTSITPAGAITAATGAQNCGTPITYGYYRQWRDVATTKPEDRAPNVQRLSEVPPEIDIVSVFATKPAEDPDFWVALRDTYLPALHAQGTKAVFTLWIDDFAKAPVADNTAAYDAYAQQLYDEYIVNWGVDGIDIDVESTPSGTALTRAAGIISALGKRIGPKSASGKLFIYDTNLTGSHPVFTRTSSLYNYVMLQAYGRGASTLQSTWQTFSSRISSCQFLPGVSFYEERGAHWGDTLDPFETSRAASYAKWQPTGGEKGGVFAYAIDRDGKQPGDDTISTTDYSWMKRLDALAQSVDD
ncbi:endo-beta-N-acetylglucosaminidase family protein [Kribbella sp. NPDC056951]|uniref:endo-beta-N-acetylglucosaminidase family protein n=1 Tax=Kribbella sp. NPDC056951 TaxID=3345978 RepID=UPI00363F47D1